MSSSLAPCKCKAGVICGCFFCYACYWKRWTASPNRDIINDILDVVESIPLKGDRMKKKKKKKKTNADEDALEQSAKKSPASWNQITVSSEELVPNDEGPSDANANVPLDSGSRFLCDIQDVPIAIARKASTRCRKRLFRTMKQKQNFTTDPHSDALQHEVSSSFPEGEIHNHSQTIAMEMTSEAPSFTAFAFASPDFEGKNCERPHQYLRSTKRRTNQVLPLNYEDGSVSGSEKFQESVIGSGVAHSCMSPTAADAGLGSRGLLGRVFPDTLGRIASRLWDLVSVRSRSHSVEYH
ncbi:hypothetical protein KP509_30G064000 [Ceratopteris richardii]|nr:hypothetical protein KP509_30G064000 [Ceratopteris richardii]